MSDRPVALVTGASRGIGRAVATRLAAAGHDVACVGRDAGMIDETLRACRAAGARAEPVLRELTDADGPRDVVARAVAALGRLDVLVNNAGLYADGAVQDADLAAWDRALALNVQALVHVTHAALPHLLAAPRGSVVNIASVAGKHSYAGGAMYCATKHAVVGFSHGLFADVRERGVRVAAICPGYVATQMVDGRGVDRARALQPDDVADACLYILSSRATACPTEILLQPQHSPVG